MKYTVKSGLIRLKYTSFEKATNKLVKLGKGKLYHGKILVGEL